MPKFTLATAAPSAEHPAGCRSATWIFVTLGFLSVFFAFLLRQ
jgi:hypothetical protein